MVGTEKRKALPRLAPQTKDGFQFTAPGQGNKALNAFTVYGFMHGQLTGENKLGSTSWPLPDSCC